MTKFKLEERITIEGIKHHPWYVKNVPEKEWLLNEM